MAHNKDLNFYIKPTETCGNIELHEEIDFDSIGYERDEIALALFYKTTDDTDWNCDITNNNNNPITLTLEYGGLYEFNLFAVLVWTDPTTVVSNGIVYYEGYFWKNISLSPQTTAPVVGSNWEKLDYCTDYSNFLAFVEATDNDPFTGGYYTSLYDYSCVKASYTRIGCNEFRITTTETSGTVMILLYDYAKTTLINTYYIDTDADETYVDIDLDADGVYLIEMGIAIADDETLDNPTWIFLPDTTEEILMAYCNIETCWASLTNELLCKPINVCCQSCDADALESLEKKRYTLNAMTNLWFKLIAYIQVEQGQYYQMSRVYEQNGSVISVDRVNYLKQVEDTITRLGEIVSACGDCENDDIVTDNCRNC